MCACICTRVGACVCACVDTCVCDLRAGRHRRVRAGT